MFSKNSRSVMLTNDAEKWQFCCPITRFKDISNDMKSRVAQQIKCACWCSCNPAGWIYRQILRAQLIAFAKFIYNDAFKDEFLFSCLLKWLLKQQTLWREFQLFLCLKIWNGKTLLAAVLMVNQQCWAAIWTIKLL